MCLCEFGCVIMVEEWRTWQVGRGAAGGGGLWSWTRRGDYIARCGYGHTHMMRDGG